MRVIHEFTGDEPYGSVAVAAYRGSAAERPEWRGARVEICFYDGGTVSQPGADTTPFGEIHFSSVEAARRALESTLGMLNETVGWAKEEIEDHGAYCNPCPECGTWVDNRLRDRERWHADGRGNLCLGDGTALITEREICTLDGVERSFRDIAAGDVFRSKDLEFDSTIYTATVRCQRVFDPGLSPPHCSWRSQVIRDRTLPVP